MDRRDLQIFFGLQVFASIWAGGLFSHLDNKVLAGGLAGFYFIGFGIFMLIRMCRWAAPLASLSFYTVLVHVFVISIPLFIIRLYNYDIEFSEVEILGMSGPLFHKVSTSIFSCLMLATVVDWLRCLWRARMRSSEG